MSAFIIRRSLLAIYIVFLIVTAGFIGILMFEGVLDKDGAVAATTRYVGGGGSGNYSKIQDAIDAASDGDTIRVFAGNYNGSVVIDKMISLIGNGSTKTTINGSGSGDVVRITKDWVNISGFNITNSGNEADPEFDSGIELGNVQNVTVCDNSCIYNNYGILLKTSQSNTIFNNTCNFNSNVGINLINSNSNIIENNTCNLNIYAGLYLDKSDSNTIENNTLISNGLVSTYMNQNRTISKGIPVTLITTTASYSIFQTQIPLRITFASIMIFLTCNYIYRIPL